MKVSVKTLTGLTCEYEVGDDDTVENLKDIVMGDQGIPMDQQRLIFDGKQLEDGRSLSSYGIMDDAIVHLVLRLSGC